MARYIKKRINEAETRAADQKIKNTVETILSDVREHGDTAVRELSQQFDNWSPERFRLSPADIEALIASLPQQTLDDIKFAQAQVRNFAQEQRKALRDIEVET